MRDSACLATARGVNTIILGYVPCFFAFTAQVMHRDLKLANLLIGANGHLKVGRHQLSGGVD